jgi:hypothetical protein
MVSALLGVSVVITIPAFLGLEQLFATMRIAGVVIKQREVTVVVCYC